MYHTFIPLALGEVPGDPELGGWRPLPSRLYRKKPKVSHRFRSHQNRSALSGISLCQALQYIGFELRHRKLTGAMEIIANKLRQK